MSAVRRARAEAVAGFLATYPCGIPVNRRVYRDFGRRGLTRAQVDRALDDLNGAGRAILATRGPQVIAYPLEPSPKGTA